MICVICHGEEIDTQEVTEEIRIGKDVVEVAVEAPVCQTCGERYFDRPTLRYLEDVEEKLRSGDLELPQVGRVLQYR